MKGYIKRQLFRLNYLINRLSAKNEQVLICEPWNIESNCVEVANYLAEHYSCPVFYALPKRLIPHAEKLVKDKVQLVDNESLKFRMLFFKSKYIFAAHWKFPKYYTKDQVIVNLWHGVGHKKIAILRGKPGLFANYTVATSTLTREAFSESFGVPMESVLITGYPRNDIMLRGRKEKQQLKQRLKGNLAAYDKIIIWLPTFRTDTLASHGTDGKAAGNAFQVEDFDVAAFNDLLLKHNALCIVKPHPLDFKRDNDHGFSNLLVISDEWLWAQGMTLYHLTACTDIMVSDISSIMVDYLLMDQPVICYSSDFSEYKDSRGFYFEDIENWLPANLVQTQPEFMQYLSGILQTGEDPAKEKRLRLKDAFFKYHDAQSSKRLLERVFEKN